MSNMKAKIAAQSAMAFFVSRHRLSGSLNQTDLRLFMLLAELQALGETD